MYAYCSQRKVEVQAQYNGNVHTKLIFKISIHIYPILGIFDKTNFLTSMSFEEIPLAFSRKISKRGVKSQTQKSSQISMYEVAYRFYLEITDLETLALS